MDAARGNAGAATRVFIPLLGHPDILSARALRGMIQGPSKRGIVEIYGENHPKWCNASLGFGSQTATMTVGRSDLLAWQCSPAIFRKARAERTFPNPPEGRGDTFVRQDSERTPSVAADSPSHSCFCPWPG